jgi:Ran GTPase-activating protein (RanGAP) involved in mRNA processing and transport
MRMIRSYNMHACVSLLWRRCCAPRRSCICWRRTFTHSARTRRTGCFATTRRSGRCVFGSLQSGCQHETFWNVPALIADVAAHVWLTGLHLTSVNINYPAVLDAVLDAALAHRLSAVQLRVSRLSPASVPALVRLLGGNALVELHILNINTVLLYEPAAALLGDALRANTSLTALRLSYCSLWYHPAAGIALCAALAGHPRLRAIDLSYNSVCKNADACAVLAALVAANAPALQQLDVRHTWLRDAGLGPVTEALCHNTHLTKLNCGGNKMSEAFARDRLLPAVRANTSLRELTVVDDRAPYGAPESAHEAAALVAARAQQSRAAAAN